MFNLIVWLSEEGFFRWKVIFLKRICLIFDNYVCMIDYLLEAQLIYLCHARAVEIVRFEQTV